MITVEFDDWFDLTGVFFGLFMMGMAIGRLISGL